MKFKHTRSGDATGGTIVERDPERLPNRANVTLSAAASWLVVGRAFNREHLAALRAYFLWTLPSQELSRLEPVLLKLLRKGEITAFGKRYLDGGWEHRKEQRIPANDFYAPVRFRWHLDCLEAAPPEPGPDGFRRFASARERGDWHCVQLDREQFLEHTPTLLREIGFTPLDDDVVACSGAQGNMSVDEMRWRWFVGKYGQVKPKHLGWGRITSEYIEESGKPLDIPSSSDAFRKSIQRCQKSLPIG